MTTYILIDASGQATVIPEDRIYEEAGRRFISGETFEIYRAEPVSFGQPAEGAAPATRRGTTTRKKGGRKAGRKAATRRQTAEAGSGRVGRPKVNVGTCLVPDCGRPQKTRGLCSAHYQQHRRMKRQGGPGLLESLGISEEEAPKTARKAKAKKASRKTRAKKTTRKAKASKAGRPARKAKAAGKKAPAKKAASKRPARKKASRRGRPAKAPAPPATEPAPVEAAKSAE